MKEERESGGDIGSEQGEGEGEKRIRSCSSRWHSRCCNSEACSVFSFVEHEESIRCLSNRRIPHTKRCEPALILPKIEDLFLVSVR